MQLWIIDMVGKKDHEWLFFRPYQSLTRKLPVFRMPQPERLLIISKLVGGQYANQVGFFGESRSEAKRGLRSRVITPKNPAL